MSWPTAATATPATAMRWPTGADLVREGPVASAVHAGAAARSSVVALTVAAIAIAAVALRPVVARRPSGPRDAAADGASPHGDRVDRRDEHVDHLVGLLDAIARALRTGLSLTAALDQSLAARPTCLPGVLRRLRAGSALHDALTAYDPRTAHERPVLRALRHGTARASSTNDANHAGDITRRDVLGSARTTRRWPASATLHRADDERLVVQMLIACCRSGGQLALPVERAAAVLRERRAWRRERRAQSAQARLSAAVMTSLPIGFATWGVATSATVRAGYRASPLVIACAAVGLALNAVGWCWMQHLVRGDRR